MSGDAFIFINKQRTHLKLLAWERGGFSIFYRRLEKGTFRLLGIDRALIDRKNPREYLEDIMRRIQSHNFSKLYELLPVQWLKARQPS